MKLNEVKIRNIHEGRAIEIRFDLNKKLEQYIVYFGFEIRYIVIDKEKGEPPNGMSDLLYQSWEDETTTDHWNVIYHKKINDLFW